MRRTLIEVIILIAALVSTAYAVMSETRMRDLELEAATLKDENTKLDSHKQSTQKRMEELILKERQFDAARYALSIGTMLADLEAVLEKSSTQTAEQQLALGGLRLLVKGSDSPDTLKSFQSALELVEWSKHIKMMCAAQIGIAATGKEQQLLEECTRTPARAPEKSASPRDGAQADATASAKTPAKN